LICSPYTCTPELRNKNIASTVDAFSKAADFKQRTACLPSVLLPVKCTVCLSNKSQDCATSQ